MVSGFTSGQDKVRKLDYDKRDLILIDNKRSKLVRVVPRAEVMTANKKSDSFQNCRMEGVPPDKVPLEMIGPLMESALTGEREQLLQVSETFVHPYGQTYYPFGSFVCEERGEAVVVEEHGHIKNGKKVCIPCAEKSKHA